jgi:hypothetical protein
VAYESYATNCREAAALSVVFLVKGENGMCCAPSGNRQYEVNGLTCDLISLSVYTESLHPKLSLWLLIYLYIIFSVYVITQII